MVGVEESNKLVIFCGRHKWMTPWVLNTAFPPISAASLDILIEIRAAPLNAALIRIVTIFFW